jgi:outer membrane protein
MKSERIRLSLSSIFSFFIAALAIAATHAAAAQAAESTKIGFVSVERIVRESADAKAALVKLEAEFSKRKKELQDSASRLKAMYDKLEKESAVTPDSELARRQKDLADQDKDFQRRQREYNEDLNQRQNEEYAAVLEKANKALKTIAEAEKYDLVLQDTAAYVNPRVDITDKVIKALNSGK